MSARTQRLRDLYGTESIYPVAYQANGVYAFVRAAIAEAVRLSEKSEDVTVRIPVILDQAYVIAAGKNLGGAGASRSKGTHAGT